MTRRFGEKPDQHQRRFLNADGIKLAIVAYQIVMPSVKVPDVKFFIYSVEMDMFMNYKL